MATTTNYSWSTPDDTALVKDGAAAIRSLGTAIDTTVFTNAGAAIAKATVDAKGDLIAGTADNTVARLAVGANNTVLTADSSTATGLKWAAAAGGGKVLQVVSTVITAGQSITSTSFTDTDINGTITPTSATSKILVMMSIPYFGDRSSSEQFFGSKLLRDATDLGIGSNSGFGSIRATGTSTAGVGTVAFIQYLDSPATTSAITYKFQSKVETSGTINFIFNGQDAVVTLMEIGA